MECKYIFFDWGYTLISKFENVDDKINKILEKIINPYLENGKVIKF